MSKEEYKYNPLPQMSDPVAIIFWKKIALIAKEMGNLKPDKTVEMKYSFKYVTFPKLARELKKQCEKYMIGFSFSTNSGRMSNKPEGNQNTGKTTIVTEVSVECTLKMFDLETGHTELTGFTSGGYDFDVAKAYGKACTYGKRYLIANMFSMAVQGEKDPEDRDGAKAYNADKQPKTTGRLVGGKGHKWWNPKTNKWEVKNEKQN